jgi:HEAT repeat protein
VKLVAVVVVAFGCARPYDMHRNDYLLAPIPRGGVEFGMGIKHFDPDALRDAIARDPRAEIRAVAVMRLAEELGARAIAEIRAVLDDDPSSAVAARAAFELGMMDDADGLRARVVHLRVLAADPATRDQAMSALATIGDDNPPLRGGDTEPLRQ